MAFNGIQYETPQQEPEPAPHGLPAATWDRLVSRYGQETARAAATTVKNVLDGWLCQEADTLGQHWPESFERAVITLMEAPGTSR